ncbi:hypothetical protein [Streptomyces sp. NBC_01451]|uniref:hypothetical protein n=1 Tax=Streptomyces sp. NBC_01451 TaxID=2903872 RepID=UPI002E2FF728|nr:hypothetical protein [Streptomyces sp. NBC_01451]
MAEYADGGSRASARRGYGTERLPMALRVHRMEPTAPEADTGEIVEGVAHYVLPRRHPTALECRLLWASLGLGEGWGTMADELANSLRLR